jgi:hypothetical protein
LQIAVFEAAAELGVEEYADAVLLAFCAGVHAGCYVLRVQRCDVRSSVELAAVQVEAFVSATRTCVGFGAWAVSIDGVDARDRCAV